MSRHWLSPTFDMHRKDAVMEDRVKRELEDELALLSDTKRILDLCVKVDAADTWLQRGASRLGMVEEMGDSRISARDYAWYSRRCCTDMAGHVDQMIDALVELRAELRG